MDKYQNENYHQTSKQFCNDNEIKEIHINPNLKFSDIPGLPQKISAFITIKFCAAYIQIGCKMECTFCQTAFLGLIGNLKAAEILEQIAHTKQIQKYHINDGSGDKKKKEQKFHRLCDSVTFLFKAFTISL